MKRAVGCRLPAVVPILFTLCGAATPAGAVHSTPLRSASSPRPDSRRPASSHPASPAGSVDFNRQVLPLLKASCATCHGAARTSGLSVLSAADLVKGGEKAGAAIIPGRGKTSPLVEYLRGERLPRMPLNGTAPAGMADLLEKWINQGALVDGKPPRGAAPAGILPPVPAGWPYRKPVQWTPPRVHNLAWVRTPIDAFVLAQLEAHKMHPAPEASRETLIRRATYDLLGLPPTPDEIRQFVADPSPGAYEKLIDRLLASPHYGERWGRHWLDLARYADTDGYENDAERSSAWRYRDYVIRSFNDDKPYNRFIQEQLAGDELWPHDPDALVATAFLRNGPWDNLAFDHAARWNDFLTDDTDTTGSVFLGLTLGCARCHDHKYDPIPQRDYYRLQSFFAAVRRVDVPLEAPSTAARPGGAPASSPGNAAKPADGKAAPAEAMAVTDDGVQAPKHFLLIRGDVTHPGEEVTPGFPTALAGLHPDAVVTPLPALHSTGRRTALANWIASRDNPQTARVMVNRVWQYHFGQGLVGTPSDFGKNGDPPANPHLLDWLASIFEQPDASEHSYNCGWRLKKLQKLIMMSSTYRQSTTMDARCAKIDPDNLLLWRMNRQRLEGEEIRDAMLAVSGDLNPAMGGPGVYPEVEAGVLDTGSTHKWGSSPPADQVRRTIYVFQRRSVVLPIVDAFDGADMSGACPRRAATTIAPQALVLLNSPFTLQQSQRFASRVRREAGEEPASQVDRAFVLALGRHPHPSELKSCLAFLTRQAALYRRPLQTNEHSTATGGKAASTTTTAYLGPGNAGSPAGQGAAANPGAGNSGRAAALTDLCHVLFNTNEFVYLE